MENFFPAPRILLRPVLPASPKNATLCHRNPSFCRSFFSMYESTAKAGRLLCLRLKPLRRFKSKTPVGRAAISGRQSSHGWLPKKSWSSSWPKTPLPTPSISPCGGAAPANTADWAFIARRFFRRFAAIFPRFFIKGTAALPMRRNFHPIFPSTAAPTRSPFGTSCTV